jgi:ribosome-binding protein aMBF1 (putative translation factor)
MPDHYPEQDMLLGDIGRRIREARGERGLSLDQLARLTGISAPAICLWKMTASPSCAWVRTH